MTDSVNFSQRGPEELIEQAKDIVMNRFDLDAAHALGVIRRMSDHNSTQMHVVAEAMINHTVSDEAKAKSKLFKAAQD